MSNPGVPESQLTAESTAESGESFGELLSQYEKSHSRKSEGGGKQLVGTVIVVTGESVFLDIGFKSEGILPLAALQGSGESVKPGDKLAVSVKGRDPEGYYQLTRAKVERPKDWSALEKAFADKATIVGTVTGVIKGGLSVDVGVRAFMPASRSGAHDAAEMEKLVEQEILCRIIKLDVTEEDVVVDRRAVAEEEERSVKERRYSEMKEGDTMSGTVRSLTDYGAFVDLGGVDALLHVSDLSWSRVSKPADVLSVGQQIEAKVLKIANDSGKRRISVGMKQLQPHPWDAGAGKYKVGERVRGAVTRVVEFGAFVELEPGIEGLIHVSEMSWGKKLRSASTLVKPGEVVDAVILGVNTGERRISLGLKQALGDPWAEVAQRFAAGSVIDADGVVLAVPAERAAGLGAGAGIEQAPGWNDIGVSPIVNVHVVYDRRVMTLPFAAAVDSPVQWVFDKTRQAGLTAGQYLAVSLSAADGYADMPTPELRAMFLPALERLFPAAANASVQDFFVTRERRATFRQAPGCSALRPGAATSVPGLTLAGAWTNTGWPDTMEGAVRSGNSAAQELIRQLARLPLAAESAPRGPAQLDAAGTGAA